MCMETVRGSKKVVILSNIAILAIILLVFNMCFAVGLQEAGSTNIGAPIYHGDTSKTHASLMINVYWGSEYIDDILKVLQKNDIKTTFFVGGYWAVQNTQMLKKIIENGHEIGNHGYFHKDQDKLSFSQNLEEIKKCHDLIKSQVNYEMRLFAPPSGAFNENVLGAASSLNYKTIMWTKDTIDWRDHNSSLVLERATKNIQNGDFILAHPTEHTLKALQGIIDKYNEAGVKLTTVSNCL